MNSNIDNGTSSRSIMIVDPQTEGHHLTWIRYVTRTFLNHHFQVTLVADLRNKSKGLVKEAVAGEIKDIRLLSAFDDNGRYHGGNCLKSIDKILDQYPANNVFMNELDLIASNSLRKAAMGLYSPKSIRGKLSGVYFRPRFLAEKHFSISNTVKSHGFRRLCENQWFKHFFLMDEQLIDAADKYPNTRFHVLPDPWDGDFSMEQTEAQEKLDLPKNKFILLQFGIGTRRKGLHLVIEAMQKMPESSPVFLLCAGKLAIDKTLRNQLFLLEEQGKAKIMDRYVSHQEEQLCFCAADTVLLPYVEHFGSSSVLSRAAASGKTVLASDYGLTGWRVHHHELGYIFKSQDAGALRSAIKRVLSMNEEERSVIRNNALEYAKTCSLEAFESALVAPFINN